MSNRNPKVEAPALPAPPDTPAPQQGQSKRQITLPIDPVAQRVAVKDVFLKVAGANVLAAQMHPFVSAAAGQNDLWVAEVFIDAIRESVQPRNAIEEMLLVQMAWTHARLARLSAIAHNQERRGNVQVVHSACDRAANTFRRQMLTLAEYRRPAQPNNFLAIKQANVAHQQVVQNVEDQNLRNEIASNEQGSAPPALPSIAAGIGIPASNGAEKQAVAAKHRTQDGDGQGPIQAERDEARGA